MSETTGPFVVLGEHRRPAMPAEEVVRTYVARLLAIVRRSDPKPFIGDDRLARSTIETLDDVVAPPACGPLLQEIDATVGEWEEGMRQGRREHRLVLVLPPCDGNQIVETWARERGHQVLEAPERGHLVSLVPKALPELGGEGILVIPRLERWFLRQRNGLRMIRDLFAAIELSDRRVIVGCNSWAWAYFARSIGADALMPDPRIFRAFDAGRLHLWFSELSSDEATRNIRFRLPKGGEDVLSKDEEGALQSDFLARLAGRSHGIPWVAWHLWRRALRSETEPSLIEEVGEAVTGGDAASEETLWVAALDEYVLPGVHEQTALLILHALLLHGGLTVAELRLVLPIVGESNVMPVLAQAGFVERWQHSFRVRAAAYPTVYEALQKAGYPMDGLT